MTITKTYSSIINLYYNPFKLTNISVPRKEFPLVYKKCPHCGIYSLKQSNTQYVICGYDNTNRYGTNNIGCMRDWCFVCNKKLCKSWDDDKLYNINNRYHNSICCEEYCCKNNEDIKNYCDCAYH